MSLKKLIKIDIQPNSIFNSNTFWFCLFTICLVVEGAPWSYTSLNFINDSSWDFSELFFAKKICFFISSGFSILILYSYLALKKEAEWNEKKTKRSFYSFILFLTCGVLVNALTLNFNPLKMLGISYESRSAIIYSYALALGILFCISKLLIFNGFLDSLTSTLTTLSRFKHIDCTHKASLANHEKAISSSSTSPKRPLTTLKNRLKRQIRWQHLKQIMLILLIFGCILGCQKFFSEYSGNSVLSEIHKAARVINSSRLSTIVTQEKLDSQLATLKNEAKTLISSNQKIESSFKSVYNYLFELTKFSKNKDNDDLQKIRSGLDELVQNYALHLKTTKEFLIALAKVKTVSDGTDHTPYLKALKDLKAEAKELDNRLKEYQPIDWEAAAVRIAFLSIIIVVIRLLFSAFKQVSTQLAKLQDQLLTIEIALANKSEDYDAIGDLFIKIVTNQMQENPTDVVTPIEIVQELIRSKKITPKDLLNSNN